MALAVGSCLGPYEILAAIGAAGMGEVYRATDTNLGRPAGRLGALDFCDRHQPSQANCDRSLWKHEEFRESTVVSMHATADAAFNEIDRLSAQMIRTGARSDAVELLVV